MSARRPSTQPPASFEPAKRRRIPTLALGIAEAAQAIGVSQDVFNESIRPDLKLIRIGRRRLIAVAELERWLADHAERVFDDPHR